MIWLVAILLLAVFAGVGYLKGAIRMSVSLAGLFVGLMLAKPMAPMMTPIYTASGMTNLLWLSLLPPITAFLVVGLVFVVVGFIVHYKIGQYYKFSADEVTRLTWER
ncbi:MAG: CvpA family protein, partial [Verrucomicrobiota bacterium]|nr:CvpA family protein [Verrucomicrobiota bacterium]